MAFSEDGTSLGTVANAGQGGDFDWYDGGSDFVDGGNDMFGYDSSGATLGDVSPVSPDFTDPNNVPEIEIVGDAPKPYVFPDDMLIPPGDILQPVPPEELPDMGTIEIVDKRPVTERPVIPMGPEITPPPYNPPIIEAPELTLPVIPEQPVTEMPEMTITDKRPPGDRIIPDLRPPFELGPITPELIIPSEPIDITIPPIVEEPPVVEPPVIPPVVEPPVIPPYIPPYVPPTGPPVVEPTVVTPPVVQPPVPSGQYLNPGLIEATPFYNTTSPEQNQFYWGTERPLQYGTEFNPKTWNDIPSAERTAWSVSPRVSAPMPVLNMPATDIQSMLTGTFNPGASNLSAEQLKEMMRLLSGRG